MLAGHLHEGLSMDACSLQFLRADFELTDCSCVCCHVAGG